MHFQSTNVVFFHIWPDKNKTKTGMPADGHNV